MPQALRRRHLGTERLRLHHQRTPLTVHARAPAPVWSCMICRAFPTSHMQRPTAARPLALLLIVLVGAAAHMAGTLDIYFIDTEGGQATLLVSPAGETFMIDV